MSRHEITYDDLDGHFRRRLGDITGRMYDRQQNGPAFVDFIANNVDTTAGKSTDSLTSDVVKQALTSLYQTRQATIQTNPDGFRDYRSGLLDMARSRRRQTPFIDAATRTFHALGGHDADVIVEDIIAASGLIICRRQEATVVPLLPEAQTIDVATHNYSFETEEKSA